MKGDKMCKSILIGLALSSHLGFSEDYNEVHPNITCTGDLVNITTYQNSEDKMSVAGYYRHNLTDNISVDAGIVSGYEAAPVIPMASLNYHWNDITFQIMPGIENNEPVGAVIAVNFTLLKW